MDKETMMFLKSIFDWMDTKINQENQIRLLLVYLINYKKENLKPTRVKIVHKMT